MSRASPEPGRGATPEFGITVHDYIAMIGGPLDGTVLPLGREYADRLLYNGRHEWAHNFAYFRDGDRYIWHGPQPPKRERPKPSPTQKAVATRRNRATERDRRRQDEARRKKREAEDRRIDAAITEYEAQIRARPPDSLPPVMWDGTDTKVEVHCHVALPPIDVVGWLLDQTETPDLRHRHAATA